MVLVKACGITTPEDARAVAACGAGAIGLVFARSSRQVSAERAREVAAALPEGVLKVGVFVDEEPDTVLRIGCGVGLDYAQLHGGESPEAVEVVRSGGLPVIKALRVRGEESLAEMERYAADLFLLDAHSEKACGGTGESFDWSLAKAVKGYANILVSGGLSAENVRAAVEFFEPYGVDASSSLESAPGRKDGERVRRFVDAARG